MGDRWRADLVRWSSILCGESDVDAKGLARIRQFDQARTGCIAWLSIRANRDLLHVALVTGDTGARVGGAAATLPSWDGLAVAFTSFAARLIATVGTPSAARAGLRDASLSLAVPEITRTKTLRDLAAVLGWVAERGAMLSREGGVASLIALACAVAEGDAIRRAMHGRAVLRLLMVHLLRNPLYLLRIGASPSAGVPHRASRGSRSALAVVTDDFSAAMLGAALRDGVEGRDWRAAAMSALSKEKSTGAAEALRAAPPPREFLLSLRAWAESLAAAGAGASTDPVDALGVTPLVSLTVVVRPVCDSTTERCLSLTNSHQTHPSPSDTGRLGPSLAPLWCERPRHDVKDTPPRCADGGSSCRPRLD